MIHKNIFSLMIITLITTLHTFNITSMNLPASKNNLTLRFITSREINPRAADQELRDHAQLYRSYFLQTGTKHPHLIMLSEWIRNKYYTFTFQEYIQARMLSPNNFPSVTIETNAYLSPCTLMQDGLFHPDNHVELRNLDEITLEEAQYHAVEQGGCLSLFLGDQNLSSMDGINRLSMASYIKAFYLIYNHIIEIPENEFDSRADGLASLRPALLLGHNKLRTLPNRLYCDALNASHNEITHLPENIQTRNPTDEENGLQELNLDYNKITRLPAGFLRTAPANFHNELENGMHLSIRYNPIDTLEPDAIHELGSGNFCTFFVEGTRIPQEQLRHIKAMNQDIIIDVLDNPGIQHNY